MDQYLFGQEVTLTWTFYNVDEVATDPTTQTLQVDRPDNTSFLVSATPPIVHLGTGQFSYTWVPRVAGIHTARASGKGAVNAPGEIQFEVIPSKLRSGAL